MFTKKPSSRIIVITAVLFVIAAITVNANWGSGFGLSLFSASASAAPESAAAPQPLIPLDTRTVCDTGTPDFATVALAVADANTAVPPGGRTYLVCAGLVETAPAGGYTITAASSAADPVVFVKDGAGANPTITASAAHTVGSLHDAVFEILGSDNVTIDGFTMLENAANTTTAAATNNMTEWGVALLYATATNGAQNCTIRNNTIDLNRTYQNSFGIYSNSTHTATVISTSASATGAAGGNSGLAVTGNTITDVNNGIVVVGPTAAADMNDPITIGGTAPNANTLTNFGSNGTFSGYANVSGTVNGILVRNSKNANVSFNSITSSVGGVTAGTLNGIQFPAFSIAPTGTFTQNVNNNTLSLQSGAITGIINGLNIGGTSASATSVINVNNNNFATFGHTVAGTASITFLTQGGAHLTQTLTGNTFTNMTVNTTGSVTFISNSQTAPAGGTKNVNNNSIVTGFSKTGAGGTVTLFTDNGSDPGASNTNNFNNNTFSNITLTGATTFAGISSTNGGAPTKNIIGNTVSNITGGTSAVTGITNSFSAGPTTVLGNTVHTMSGGGAVTGMVDGSGAGVRTVSKNKIYDLSGTGAASVVIGESITNASAGSNVTFVNNLIGNLTAPAATGANAVIGISVTGSATTSNFNVSYNTVYVNNTTSGAGFGSSGISALASATATTSTLNLRNNVIVNTSVQNGAGLTVAYRRSLGTAGTLANYGSTSNNNDFYAGTPSATNLIYADGTSTAQTIGAYKGGVFTAGTIGPRDSSSLTENPAFLSTTGSSVDFLHINPATPTQLESGGAPIAGITDDFDGNTRNVSTPDVGADEFTGIVLDLTGPSISYTALANTSLVTNRVLSASISDPSGVAGGANNPRIYFKKSTDAGYVSTQCTGSYSCTIDYTLVGGGSVTTGDIVQYFVVAQDTPGNVSGNPSAGFAATDVNTVTSPPTTPSSYRIATQLSGSKTACASGCDYDSLTNTSGVFDTINNNVVTGNLTINITGDLTAETGTVALNTVAEETGSGFVITIQPSGAARVVSGSTSANAMVRTAGASRVVIDGSIGGGGTDRSLTISNASITTPQVVRFGNVGTTPMTNNTLKNSIIINGVNTSSAVVISDSVGAAGYWTNVTIQNNDIRRAFIGVFSNAAVVAGNGSGTLYTQNKVDNAGADAMLQVALYAQGIDGATISNNTIGNFVNTDVNADTGIWLATGTVNTTVSGNTVSTLGNPVTGSSAINYGIRESSGAAASGNIIRQNTISNINHFAGASVIGIAASSGGVTIERNDVSGINNLSTGTFGAYGIDVQAGNNSVVKNNFVSNVTGNMTGGGAFSTTFGLFGIRIGGGTGHQVYNNSVNMYGLRAGTATTSLLTAAVCVVSTASTGLDIRNNIFANNITGGTTSVANVAAYLPSAGTSAMNLTWNNNSYYFGTDAAAGAGQAGTTAGTNFFTTLAALAAYSSTLHAAATNDNTSISSTGTVPFVSSTDLHLFGPAPAELNTGVTIASVTNDFDGQARPLETAYEIGADEYVVPVLTPTSTSTFTATSTATDTATATNTATPTATATCEPLTFNFANPAVITIPGGAPTTTTGPASPYPSDIVVSGLTGNVYAVKVKLNGIGHTYPDDIDVLLVGPGGQNAVIMSDVGGSGDVTGVNLTLDGDAAAGIPDETILTTGTYQPTNVDPLVDGFPAPAPAASGSSSLATFVGQPANGTWSLYVYDAFSQDHGVIAGGWELLIFTDAGPCATATNTPVNSPTNTDTPTATNTSTPTNTATNTPTPPDTVCDLTEGFEDVPGLVPNEGWYQQNNSSPIGLGTYFQGNPLVFPAHLPSPDPTPNQYAGVNFQSGSGVAVLSNWLLTPPITLQNGGVLTFYTRTTTGNPFPDRLQVRMSTNGTSTNVGTAATDVGDFTTLLLDINPTYIVGPTGYPEDWTLYTVTISGMGSQAKGRIAFRYFVEDAGPGGNNSNYIGIDTLDYDCAPATPTATATNTATNTPTPADTPSVAGTVTYGNPVSPLKFISNATVASIVGSPVVSTTTGAPGVTAGQYTLTGFGSGGYTIRVTKTTGQNGVASGDAARIAQHVAGISPITNPRQLIAADVTNNNAVASADAANIARFVAGLGITPGHVTNTWRFFVPGPSQPTFPIGASPTTRSYTDPIGVNTGQDYIGILGGEVTGNWAAGPLRPTAGPVRSTAVELPRLVTPADGEVVIPIAVKGAADKGIISYEFDLRYDPSVIQPQADPVDLGGTASRGLSAVANPNEPGLLRVVLYGAYPIETDGLLLNLRFNAVGAPGSVSPITFERIVLNEGDPATLATDGAVELSAAGANQAEISGRLLGTMGQGIPNARVTLTDTKGETRYVMSNGFGAYRFGNLQVGQTYTLSVESRNAMFAPLTVSVTGPSVDVDLIAAQ